MWEIVSTAPVGFIEGAVERIGNSFVVYGNSDSNGLYFNTYLYTPEEDSWKKLPSLKHCKFRPGMISYGPYLYMMGGRDAPSNGYNDNSMLNLTSRIDLSL